MGASLWVLFCISWTTCVKPGDSLTPCTNGVTEVLENANSTLTCSGLDSNQSVSWSISKPASTRINVGSCGAVTPPAQSSTCIPGSLPGVYTATRPTPTSSVMTIDPSVTSSAEQLIVDYTLACAQGLLEQSCLMDLIYPSEGVSCRVQFLSPSMSTWSVSGRCNVTNAYSSLGTYTCQWYQRQQTSSQESLINTVNMTTTPIPGGKYVRGTCVVTASYPSAEGLYTYRVVISPGQNDQTASFVGTNLIRAPNASHNCPQYVTADQSMTCTCGGDVGSPAGLARWLGSDSDQLTVTSALAGEQQTCHVIYNNMALSPRHYTVQLAYGPSGLTITGTTPFDTDGSQNLTLTCSTPGGSNPPATFTWSGPPSTTGVHQDHTYTFQPHLSDDGTRLSCKAVNPVTGVAASHTWTLHLNYPPATDPVITSSSTEDNLYQGDTVTLTCSVTGGKPLNVTSVTFTCAGQQDTRDVMGSAGVSSSVTYTNLTSAVHDTGCTCTTAWKTTSWYNRRVTYNISVNSPPTKPTINSTDYPLIVSVSRGVTFTCVSDTPGQPPATYTWPLSQGGQAGTDGQGRGTLTFDTLRRDHEGKVVSCRASNLYTDNRQRVEDGSLTLDVFYHPEISITLLGDKTSSHCVSLTSHTVQCTVTEGQSAHFNCSAVSNPAPRNISWHTSTDNSFDLLIDSVNRSQHNGVFNCSAITSNGGYSNDPRMPLRSQKSLTMVVNYLPSILSFTANHGRENVTVTEGDNVILTCQADGRPTPAISVTNAKGGSLSDAEGGQVSVNVTVGCHDTGLYSCDATNGEGSAQQRLAAVYVQCAPQRLDNTGDLLPPINFRYEAEHVKFSLVAYPAPWLLRVDYFKQRPTSSEEGIPAHKGLVSLVCPPPVTVSYVVICTLTVENVERDNAGYYKAVIGNDIGSLSAVFEIQVNATETSNKDNFPVAAVAGGVVAALIVIAVIVVVLVLLRRRKAKQTKEPQHTNAPEVESTEQPALHRRNNFSHPRSSYEDVDMDEATPVIAPQQQAEAAAPADGAIDADRVYARVVKKKDREPQPATEQSSVSEAAVYAQVVKPKKMQAGPASAEAEASAGAADSASEDQAKADVKPKPAKKPTPVKQKEKRNQRRDENIASSYVDDRELEPMYGNTEPLHVTAHENPVYEGDTNGEAPSGEDDSFTVNQDGLVYSKVVFNDSQRRRAQRTPAPRENTDYAAIDFAASKQKH